MRLLKKKRKKGKKENATNELLQLCNEILETINLESGKSVEKVESFNIRELVSKNITLLSHIAANKRIVLSAEIDEEVPIILKGKRKYLYRSILNLVSNALKFTEKGFVKIKITPFKKDNGVVTIKIVIEDTGIGIPRDKFETIFENFSRLTPSFEGNFKGSGLGLHTVKQYVNAMSGKIEVKSEVNKGTSFILTVPFLESGSNEFESQTKDLKNFQAEQIKPISADSKIFKNKVGHILVVEDNNIAAMAISVFLKPLNCNVDIVKNGAKAIEMAGSITYDLILMDIGLPDYSGIDVTKTIRSFTDIMKSKVPIVAITGHGGNKELQDQAIEAGMQTVLSKPVKSIDLERILRNYALHMKN